MRVGQSFCPHRIFDGYFTPECLLPYQGISYGAKFCLAVLYRHIGKNDVAWPGQEGLAEKMNVSVRTIHTYLKELEDDGFIQSIRIGLGQTNQYRALWHPLFDQEDDPDASDPSRKEPSGQDSKETSDPSIELKRVNGREPLKQADMKQPDSETPSDPEDLIRIWNRVKGLGRLGKAARQYAIQNWKGQLSADDLWEALRKFAEWLPGYKGATPLHVFMKDPASWLTYRTVPKDEPKVKPVSTVDTPLSQTEGWIEAIKAQELTPPPRDYPAEWNAIVTASPVEWDPLRSPVKALRRATEDPQFGVRFTEVCNVAQAIHEARGTEGAWCTFEWILKVKDDQAGWFRLLTDMRGMSKAAPKKLTKHEQNVLEVQQAMEVVRRENVMLAQRQRERERTR